MTTSRCGRALLLVAALTTNALADDDPKAMELFEKGRALVKAEKHADACPLFEQAFAIQEALGIELNLAVCWAKIGKLVDAKRTFESILRKTVAPGQEQRHQLAEAALLDIAERMPKLQIERGSIPESATVWVDGTELVDTSEPIAVDPGEHVVEAEGAKKQTVIAVEKQVAEVILEPGTSETRPTTEPVDTGGGFFSGWTSGDRRPLYIASAGGAFLVAGTITGILTLSKKSDGLALCEGPEDRPTCDADGKAKLDSARTLSHVTTGFFVVGTGLVVTAVIWKLQGNQKKADQPVVTGWVTGSAGGFALERTW